MLRAGLIGLLDAPLIRAPAAARDAVTVAAIRYAKLSSLLSDSAVVRWSPARLRLRWRAVSPCTSAAASRHSPPAIREPPAAPPAPGIE